jgi:hypothetical protein
MKINFPILKDKFKHHKKLKPKILKEIENQISSNMQQYNEYYTDSISKLDWNRKNDFNRSWVKVIVKDLHSNFTHQVKNLGLSDVVIHDIWFQQYVKGDTHGWHVHGHNFTGVYYLELSNCSPRTEIIEPVSCKKIVVNAEEGDIVIFPSVYIHRAPKVVSDKRKTIISFNLETEFLDKNYLNKLQKLY